MSHAKLSNHQALGVVTNIVVGSVSGQGNTQIATNTIAPYASELIGDTFDHTDDPNKAAQLLSHAILGAIIARVNGSNATSGAASAVVSEETSMILAKELYPEAFDENGNFDRSQLSEEQANGILALSSAIGALVGGMSGGSVYDASVGGFVGQNAVENNDMFWNPSDINRMNALQNGFINQKIRALIEAGLTPEQIKKSLANDATFRALTKNGDEGFNALYDYEKGKVDSLNKRIDNIATAMEIAGTAVMFIDGISVKLTDMAAKNLIKEAIEQGLRISPDKIVSIAKVDGKIVWLEKGSSSAGLQHIIERHSDDFAKWGVESSSISNFVISTVKTGRSIGKYGADGSVYKVIVNGEIKYINVVIGSNGYIVNAYPLGIKNLGGIIWK